MTDENIIIPSNPTDRQKIRDMVIESSNAMIRAEAEKELIKEIRNRAKDEFQLPPKQFARMVKAYHKDTYKKEISETETFDALYTSIIGTQNP